MEEENRMIKNVLEGLGRLLLENQDFSSTEIHEGHDLHGFYLFPSQALPLVVHVKGYPGMSNPDRFYFSARLRDYDRMMQERQSGGVSIGNEHESNIQRTFLAMQQGIILTGQTTQQMADSLEKLIEKGMAQALNEGSLKDYMSKTSQGAIA